MPNFHHESKVTCRQIFVLEIWYFARMPKESIDWDHTHSKVKPQSLHACKAPKANAKIMVFYYQSPNIMVLSKQMTVFRQTLWGA